MTKVKSGFLCFIITGFRGSIVGAIHYAVNLGDNGSINRVLRQDFTLLHSKDHNGFTPLHIAVISGKTSVVELLIKMGANINMLNDAKKTELYEALFSANPAALKVFLGYGNAEDNAQKVEEEEKYKTVAELKAEEEAKKQSEEESEGEGQEDEDGAIVKHTEPPLALKYAKRSGLSALHLAIIRGDTQTARVLIKAGADLNVRNDGEVTPLHLAVLKNNIDIVKMLIDCGADCKLSCLGNMTPLYTAVEVGSEDMVKALLKQGVDVNMRDTFNLSFALDQAIKRQQPKITKYLLEADADKNLRNADGYAALHEAIAMGDIEIVKLLIEFGADVNGKGEGGVQPINVAIQHGRNDIVEELVAEGVKLDMVDEQGYSLLHKAVIEDSQETVEMLIERGADVNMKSSDGGTPLYLAAIKNNIPLMRLLLDKGADINARGDSGMTALRAASEEGHLDAVTLLTESGAEINAQSDRGVTPLVAAARNGHRTVMEYLIEHGAHVNTAVRHLTGDESDYETLQLLIENGADVDAEGFNGNTLLHKSAGKGAERVLRLLVAKGADVMKTNHDDKTPRMIAAQHNQKNIADYLNTLEPAGTGSGLWIAIFAGSIIVLVLMIALLQGLN